MVIMLNIKNTIIDFLYDIGDIEDKEEKTIEETVEEVLNGNNWIWR